MIDLLADPALAAVAAFVVFAYAVQTMTGFGSQVIALSLSALLLPIGDVMPVILALNLVLCGWVALRERRHVRLGLLLRTVGPWMGAGVVAGILVAQHLVALPRWPFGVVVTAFASMELVRLLRGRAPAILSPAASHAWLVAGGVVHGLYASGGPLVVTALARSRLDREAFRATLMALWLVFNGVVLASLLARGAWTEAISWRTLALLPTVPAGILLGEWLRARVDERSFRLVVQVTLLVAGVALVM